MKNSECLQFLLEHSCFESGIKVRQLLDYRPLSVHYRELQRKSIISKQNKALVASEVKRTHGAHLYEATVVWQDSLGL